MSKIKHFISYLYPVIIDAKAGEINNYLEVRKSNGKFILDGAAVNYSYGGLQKLFDKLFQKINIRQYDFNNVLMLGMGAGSVISLLTEKYKKECQITSVEKDIVVIELATKYFDIQRFKSLRIILDDAFKFTEEEKEKYDLIIVDLFINDEVPKKFASSEFISNLRKIATNNCCIIYNKMTDKPVHKEEFANLLVDFEKFFPGAEVHKLSSYGAENSFIYYNTLPTILPALKTTEQTHVDQDSAWSDLKPAFNYDKTKSKN